VAEQRKVPDICKDIGKRIASLRKKAGMTQEVLAEQIEADTSYLARIEIGQRQPSIDKLDQIAKALGVPLGQLFTGWAAGMKLPAGERAWTTQAKILGKSIEELSAADLKLLVKLAERLGHQG
jgi:transcriptional regulator with XRE-family HTH domain